MIRPLLHAGLLALAWLPAHPSAWALAWRLAVCGAGFGLFQSPNNHTIVTSAPPHRSGGAAGMLGTARLTGQSLGALLIGGLYGLWADQTGQVPGLAEHGAALAAALQRLGAATKAAWSTGQPEDALANATPYLQAFGHVVLAWTWLEVALAAKAATGQPAAFVQGKLQACRYFFAYELPKIDAWLGVVAERNGVCRDMQDDWF